MAENIYLARQPIMDRSGQLYGFELSFRANDSDESGGPAGMRAAIGVLRGLLADIGLPQVLGKLRGFLAVDAEFLHSELPALLGPDRFVFELPAGIACDAALLQRCAELRKSGFEFSLSGYSEPDADLEALLPLVRFVKVNVEKVAIDALSDVCAAFLQRHVVTIAENIVTQTQADRCREAGFEYFQGYYFAKPEVLSGKRAAQSRTSMLRLLALIYSDAELSEIEDEFKRHPQLGYNLLRLVNSAAAGLSTKIASIKHALVLLGRRQLQLWLQLLLYAGDGPELEMRSPLLQMAAMRGRLMEAIARHEDPQGGQYQDYAFIAGMLSLADVLLGMSRVDVVEQLNLADELRVGLLRGEGRLGRLLDLMERMESSDRQDLEPLLAAVKLNLDELLLLELGALRWANELLDAV